MEILNHLFYKYVIGVGVQSFIIGLQADIIAANRKNIIRYSVQST